MPRFILFLLLLGSTLASFAELIDPSMPPNWNSASVFEKAPADLELTAIFSKYNNKIAIINDTEVKKGDMINGYKVMRIDPNAVHLQNANGFFMIQLFSDSILTPHQPDTSNRTRGQ